MDIDGVLNTSDYRDRLGLEYFSSIIEKGKLTNLKKIVDATGAKIVLASTWRKYRTEYGAQKDKAGKMINETFRAQWRIYSCGKLS